MSEPQYSEQNRERMERIEAICREAADRAVRAALDDLERAVEGLEGFPVYNEHDGSPVQRGNLVSRLEVLERITEARERVT